MLQHKHPAPGLHNPRSLLQRCKGLWEDTQTEGVHDRVKGVVWVGQCSHIACKGTGRWLNGSRHALMDSSCQSPGHSEGAAHQPQAAHHGAAPLITASTLLGCRTLLEVHCEALLQASHPPLSLHRPA